MSVLTYSIPGPSAGILYHNLVGHSGTTAQRQSNPRTNQTYYDTTLGAVIKYDGTNWKNILTGATV